MLNVVFNQPLFFDICLIFIFEYNRYINWYLNCKLILNNSFHFWASKKIYRSFTIFTFFLLFLFFICFKLLFPIFISSLLFRFILETTVFNYDYIFITHCIIIFEFIYINLFIFSRFDIICIKLIY